jgi:hypothetical protein
MRKQDELKGPSCLTRAADDEPIFVLRAHDELASMAVRQWAFAYRKKNTREGSRDMTPKQQAKYREAMALATEMDLWRQCDEALREC